MSRPFPAPATGKIAVKVINHYGDEVMKVYDTPVGRVLPLATSDGRYEAGEKAPGS